MKTLRDLIGRFPGSGERGDEEAVRSARKGFEVWRKVPAPQRGEVMRRVADLLARHREDIARSRRAAGAFGTTGRRCTATSPRCSRE